MGAAMIAGMVGRIRRGAAFAMVGLAVLAAFAAPAAADWHDDFKVLRVGVLAGSDAGYRLAELEPFRAYLQDKLGVPVELVPAGNYAALIDAEVSARVQYAINSASSFAAANASCHCLEPIALPTAADGAKGFYSLVVVKADSPVHALSDARGLRLAVAGPDSVAGRLVPMKAFAREGINAGTFFSRIVDTPDPAAAMGALLSGDADAATAWSSLTGDPANGYDFGLLTDLVANGTLSMDQVRVVWQSRLIPFGPHVVLASLPEALRNAIKDALLAMAEEAPDALDAVDRMSEGGGGMVAADASLYAVMDDLVSKDSGPAGDKLRR